MSDETDAAIKAAEEHLDWAIGVWTSELATREGVTGTEAGTSEVGTLPARSGASGLLVARLRERSAVAAEAVELALADIREYQLDPGNPKVVRAIAGCYVYDVVLGVSGLENDQG